MLWPLQYTPRNPYEEVDDENGIIIIIIIMNKLQETTVFHGRQKLTSGMK